MNLTIIKRQIQHGPATLTETRYIVEFSILQALVSCLAVLIARGAFYFLRSQKIVLCTLAQYYEALHKTMHNTMKKIVYSLFLPHLAAV